MDEFYTEISIGTSVNFDEEIYATIPYEKENAYIFIIYRDMAKLVELGTNVIAAKFLYHYWEMKLAEYDSVSGEYKVTFFTSLNISE
ncbi:hypothetical protein [Tetragenococcus halophilus]|uniref:hypothetical protein n=1 Tax=Tetragenococcus halophilus TaxID=51669 RepID=UPI000B9267F1|nr:hypothetical protein [Tetragenococcus halophilus]